MADKEYIERGALIRLFDERYITAIVQQKHDDVPEDHKKHWKGIQSGTNWCRNTVIEAPAADVVEVVRCKDCVWWEARTHGSWIGRCENPRNGLVSEYSENDDFCSHGERKEQT